MSTINTYTCRETIAKVTLAIALTILLPNISWALQGSNNLQKGHSYEHTLYLDGSTLNKQNSINATLIHRKKHLNSVLTPLREANFKPTTYTQSSSLRSKSSVINEVKNRYNGEVVKVSFNENKASYSVRVLLPNGKVKNVQVSARK